MIAFVSHRHDESQRVLAADFTANLSLLIPDSDNKQSSLVAGDFSKIIQFYRATMWAESSTGKYEAKTFTEKAIALQDIRGYSRITRHNFTNRSSDNYASG